jgi:exopolysaccharide production negative regulator
VIESGILIAARRRWADMRTSRLSNVLISALAGSALAVAGPAAPAHAQGLGAAIAHFFGFGGSDPTTLASATPAAAPAAPPPSLTSQVAQPPGPTPPAAIPDDPPAASSDTTRTAENDAEPQAAPVAPDKPVASASLGAPPTAPATAADATLTMATMMDGAGGGISNADLMSALEDAAAAGQPMALWRLGTMYEDGDGVAKDDVKAFGYFSEIANDQADAAPRGVDADIVAESFVKMGDYYEKGLPDAGISVDPERAEQLLLHAATYFGNADAQYRVGELYLNSSTDPNPLQGARWLALAAHKGHVAAQAKLGDLLFNGAGIKAAPEEGLMWLTIAHDRSVGTPDEGWISELLTRDMSVATPDERKDASKMAQVVEPRFGPPDESEADQ